MRGATSTQWPLSYSHYSRPEVSLHEPCIKPTYSATSHVVPSLTFALCVHSEYGFAEKVVEGMSVRINSITIKVQSRAFHASFELWQLQGNSLNPKWQRSDLRYTRVTDPKRGEVFYFYPPPHPALTLLCLEVVMLD